MQICFFVNIKDLVIVMDLWYYVYLYTRFILRFYQYSQTIITKNRVLTLPNED